MTTQSWPKFLLILMAMFHISSSIYADHTFVDAHNNEIKIVIIKSAQEIDQVQSRKILVQGFMHAYEDVPLLDLNPQFKSIGDVRRFYESYFSEEFERLSHGQIIWIEAYWNGNLAGWATYELEPHEKDAAYMNLIVVAPEYQRLGIGRCLTFSIYSNDLFPNIKAINLLIRKVNTEGYKFYRKLGFYDYDYHRDNFVDPTLLTGMRWEKETYEK